MKTYKVIKPFFKLSNRTNYFVGDTIDLTDVEAEAKKYEGLVEDVENKKVVFVVSKEDIDKAQKIASKQNRRKND